VDLATTDKRGLALGERNAFAVAASDPTVSGCSKEDLTESFLVRPDLSARLEVDDVCVGFALTLGEPDRSPPPVPWKPPNTACLPRLAAKN
jgi:hypothetical protein